MSAEVLREAANVMRERVAKVNGAAGNDPRISSVSLGSATHLIITRDATLALADWLHHAANIFDEADLEAEALAAPLGCDCPYCKGMPLALEVARAYLGSAS